MKYFWHADPRPPPVPITLITGHSLYLWWFPSSLQWFMGFALALRARWLLRAQVFGAPPLSPAPPVISLPLVCSVTSVLSVSAVESLTLTVAFVTLDACPPALWALALHLLTTPVWLCALTFPPSALRPFLCDPSATPPFLPTGRVSLTRGASLLVERLTLEDEGWFECRILLLDREQDDFRNGTWTFLSITGAARRASGNASGAAFVAHRWHRPSLEQTQHGVWLCLWRPWQAEWN